MVLLYDDALLNYAHLMCSLAFFIIVFVCICLLRFDIMRTKETDVGV